MPLVPPHLNHTMWLWLIYKTYGLPDQDDGKFMRYSPFFHAGSAAR